MMSVQPQPLWRTIAVFVGTACAVACAQVSAMYLIHSVDMSKVAGGRYDCSGAGAMLAYLATLLTLWIVARYGLPRAALFRFIGLSQLAGVVYALVGPTTPIMCLAAMLAAGWLGITLFTQRTP